MKYKVMVIAHCLQNNKIAKFGDIVDESQLTSPAQELVNSGFIKLAEETATKKVVETKAAKNAREKAEALLALEVTDAEEETPEAEEKETEEVAEATEEVKE